MTYSTKMILAQIKAEAAEEENKRKRQEAIKAAIKDMRHELKTIPTWTQYNRGCSYGR